MQYGAYEIIRNSVSLVFTKIFHNKARLIRYPCFIRNGKNIIFNEGFTCGYNCRFESIPFEKGMGKIIFGRNNRIGDSVHIAAAKQVTIGDNVLIASNVFITDCSHGCYPTDIISKNPSTDIPANRKIEATETKIENNVWIGENVVILSGIIIGAGCVIGAGAVITKSVPDNCIVVGNPARVTKKFDEDKQVWVKVKKNN